VTVYVGTILANLIFPRISVGVGWPSIFYISASIGFVWILFFVFLVSSFPQQHKTISKEELDMLNNTVGARTVVSVRFVFGNFVLGFCFLLLLFLVFFFCLFVCFVLFMLFYCTFFFSHPEMLRGKNL
jgi:MFS family permease